MQSFAGHPPHNRKRERTSKILFSLFFLAVPYILLFPSLKKDWALLDDPDTITYSLQAIDRIITRFDFTGLYPPVHHIGTRFLPGAFLYLGIQCKILGLNPFINHLALFPILYVHLLFLHIIIYGITRRYLFSIFGILLYLFYSQGSWSSAYYNWYSLTTFEPFRLVCLVGSLILFSGANQVWKSHTSRSLILLVLAILAAGFAIFTKEYYWIFISVTGFIYVISLIKRINVLGLRPRLAFGYFIGTLICALLFWATFLYLKSGRIFSGGTVGNYNINPDYLLKEIPSLWMILFQNYTLLLLILPSSYIIRCYLLIKEKGTWGRRELIQAVFLFFTLIWWVVFLPWKPKVERLFVTTIWCFSLFGALELSGIIEFYFDKQKSRLRKTDPWIGASFWGFLILGSVFFVFGKLLLSLKVYALILKAITLLFTTYFIFFLLKEIRNQGQINRLFFSFVMFLSGVSFILHLFFGSVGAYNFNHKYDGIEGVLVRMVRTVARHAIPNARIYVHLPEGHMYIGEMNFRLPLFEKRPDLKAFAFAAQPKTEYKQGDIIIHHPWLSSPQKFPFFEYVGDMQKSEIVKIEHPFIQGATYKELKRWIIAHFTFPRNPKVKFLFKDLQRNWWEIFLVLSQKLTITSVDAKSAVTKIQ